MTESDIYSMQDIVHKYMDMKKKSSKAKMQRLEATSDKMHFRTMYKARGNPPQPASLDQFWYWCLRMVALAMYPPPVNYDLLEQAISLVMYAESQMDRYGVIPDVAVDETEGEWPMLYSQTGPDVSLSDLAASMKGEKHE